MGTRQEDERVQEASEESFPASDPPSWTPTHIGNPDPENADEQEPGEPELPNPSPS